VILIAYPKRKIQCLEKEDNFLTIMIHFLGQEKWLMFSIIKAAYLLLIVGIINTFYFKICLKYLNRQVELIIIFVFFFILLIIKALLSKEVLMKTLNLNRRLTLFHSTNFLEKLWNLPLTIFHSRSSSDYLMRFWENCDLKILYSEVWKNNIISGTTVIICIICLGIINYFFFRFYAIVSLIYIFFLYYFQKESYQLEKKFMEQKLHFQNRLLEHIEKLEVYHYLNLKNELRNKSENDLIVYLEQETKKDKFYQKYLWWQSTLKETICFVIVIAGIYWIEKEELTLINFFLIEGIGNYLFNALETLVFLIPKEKYLKNILKKSNEFLKIPDKLSTNNCAFESGDILIEKLDFTYDQYTYILKDVNFHIILGSHVLLLGKSGCGKSTICKLLTKIYTPSSGTIKINGINLLDIKDESIQKSIIYLNQRSSLVIGTIFDNIVMKRPFDQKKFLKICQICQIEELVEKRPLRYETTIEQEETNFSGGEKQRIMLARTLYSNAEIFLLDESLSEVDEKLEKQIIKEMRNFLKGKTLIYITHRPYKSLFDEVIKLEGKHERVLIS